MAIIKPFRGLRFNAAKISDLAQVVSQPYDRVRYGLQEKYYDLHPYNIVRLIKGQELPTDAPDHPAGPNVYTRARAYYDLWRSKDVLIREEKPALYVYHQTFAIDGQRMTRKGFICAFELSPFDAGVVLPHERTHAGPKVDRLRLLRATELNLGQIFMLYPDPQNSVSARLDQAIAGQTPALDVVEMFEKDVRQQVWVITDPQTIRAVQDELAARRNLIIADGHHRYETALNHQAEMRRQHPDAPAGAAFNYRMVTMVGMQDPGLVILPTHRELFDYPHVSGDQVIERARQHFDVTPAADLRACLSMIKQNRKQHAFGLYAKNGYHMLTLKNPAMLEQLIAGEHRPAWKSLDVSILHKIVLEQIVGLDAQEIERQNHIRYHRDPSLPVENVDAGRGNMVFFLNPTQMSQVQACAEQGEKMPQKSTDFYPKVITGLTMMPVAADDLI